MFKQLQEEHKLWALKNFGEQDVEDYCLGMIEEVGELAHAVLKRKQGIRNNEDHDENIKDAIGDIVIYLVGFCNHYNLNLEYLYFNRNMANHTNPDMIKTVSLINMSISLLISDKDSAETYKQAVITVLFERLVFFCSNEGFDFEDTVMNTWNEVVSKRDWKNNPDCVSADEAKKTIEDSGFKFKTKHLCNTCINVDCSCLGVVDILNDPPKVFNGGIEECNYYKEKGFKEISEDLGYPV